MRKHGLLIAFIMLGLTWAAIGTAEDQPIEQQLIDAMNKVFGVHPGFRANHAKGIVVTASFKASAEAAGLSRAVLFNGSPIPATVRFSDATGIPNLSDGAGAANPHGMPSSFIYRTAATPTW
jgi:catalase